MAIYVTCFAFILFFISQQEACYFSSARDGLHNMNWSALNGGSHAENTSNFNDYNYYFLIPCSALLGMIVIYVDLLPSTTFICLASHLKAFKPLPS